MNLSVESIGCPQTSLSRSFGMQLINFQEFARTFVHLLMEFLGDSNVVSANDVILFVREIIETNPKLRVSIIARLWDMFYRIRSSCVCSCALWTCCRKSDINPINKRFISCCCWFCIRKWKNGSCDSFLVSDRISSSTMWMSKHEERIPWTCVVSETTHVALGGDECNKEPVVGC